MTNASVQRGFSGISFLIFTACLVVIAGGVYYLWIESDHTPVQQTSQIQTPQSTQATIAAAPTTGEFRSSIPRLVRRGDTLACDWRMENTDNPLTGTLWTMANQGRSIIESNLNGIKTQTNALYKDDTVYFWNAADTKAGIKINASQIDPMNARLTPQQKQQVAAFQQDMVFNCSAWNPDPAKFAVPTAINFIAL